MFIISRCIWQLLCAITQTPYKKLSEFLVGRSKHCMITSTNNTSIHGQLKILPTTKYTRSTRQLYIDGLKRTLFSFTALSFLFFAGIYFFRGKIPTMTFVFFILPRDFPSATWVGHLCAFFSSPQRLLWFSAKMRWQLTRDWKCLSLPATTGTSSHSRRQTIR